MSNRNLAILGVVAGVMLVWAALLARLRVGAESSVQATGPSYLIQGLDPGDIDKIVIKSQSDPNGVTLDRKEQHFVVFDKAGYPADTKQVNELITQCLDIKTEGLHTANPANHGDLEVTEEKAGTVVNFFKSDGALLTGVLIGKRRETGQGNFVRLATEDKVYISPSVPWFRTNALDYVNQEIVSIEKADIEWVTVGSGDGEYTLKPKEDSEDLALEDLPEGKTLKQSDAKSVFNALSNLRFDDVRREFDDTDKLTFDRRYVCRLTNTIVYTLKLAKQDDKTYLACDAKYTDPERVTMTRGQVESPEELKKKEAKLLAQEQALTFEKRHKGWVYEIADWSAKNLTKDLSELLEDIKKEEEKPAADSDEG